MEVMVTTGAIGRAKLKSNHHHQQTNTQFFTGRMPFLSPNQQCQSTEGKISHPMELLTPSSPGGLPTLSLTTNSSWLPRGGLPCLSSALWCQYPYYWVWLQSPIDNTNCIVYGQQSLSVAIVAKSSNFNTTSKLTVTVPNVLWGIRVERIYLSISWPDVVKGD